MPNPRSRCSCGKLFWPVSMRGLEQNCKRQKESELTEIRIRVDFSDRQVSRDALINWPITIFDALLFPVNSSLFVPTLAYYFASVLTTEDQRT